MEKEVEQEIGPSTEPGESPIRLLADLRLGLGSGISHPLLDIPMTLFLRVQFRGVRWQPLHIDLGVLRQEGLDHSGAMGLQAVPDDDHRSRDLATELFQVRDRILAVDRMVEMLLADPARHGQADRRGDLASLAHAPQDRRPPLGGPRRVGADLEREPRFVDEDDHGALAVSFLFDARPIPIEPGSDQFLVALAGPDGGDLRGPTQVSQSDREVTGMVSHSEAALDHGTDPRQGPALSVEAGFHRPPRKEVEEFLPLLGRQSRRTTRIGTVPQRCESVRTASQSLGPLADGHPADTQSTSDFGLRETACPQQPARCEPSLFELFGSEFSWSPHAYYRKTA